MGYNKEKQAEYSRAWARKNPERVRAIKRRHRERNRETIAARRRAYRAAHRADLLARARAWEADNPERVAAARALQMLRKRTSALAAQLRHHYSMSIDEYLAMKASQNGCCAICGTTHGSPRGHRLNLDHCHATGFVRGLLCSRCNSTLGYMDDDADRLRRAADYLDAAKRNWLRLQGKDGTDGHGSPAESAHDGAVKRVRPVAS